MTSQLYFLFLLLGALFLGHVVVFGQDLNIPDNPYDTADEATKERKAFLRERWFYEQRMYPFNFLPDDAFGKAMRQRDEMRQTQGFHRENVTWTNIGPTPGYYFSYGNISGRTTTVKYDPNNPNIIYVGAAFGGVWKSTNGGSTWTQKTDFEASLSSGALAIDPTNSNIIYYGTGEATYSGVSYYGRGLLKSTDGGNTWTHHTSGLESFTYFSRIVIRPNAPNQLLAALGSRSSPSATGGLYRSTDGGVSWSVLVSGRADDVVFSPSGDTAYAVGSGIGYCISTNGGQTFSASGALTMQTRNHIAICGSNPSILYAATYTGSTVSVFKSTNAGFTFSQVAAGTNFSASQSWYNFYVHVNPFDPDYVYIGSIDIWRSTNGGTSFQNITNGYSGGNVHVDQHNLDFHPTNPDHMFAVNDGGVWRSTNRGTSWTNLNSTLTLTQFYRITSDPSNGSHVLGGTQDNGTQRTTGTINWAAAFGGDGGEVCFHSQNPSLILGETQYNGIYRSTNGGSSWSSSTSGLSGSAAWIAPIISHPDSANIFYTARQSVFKSTNGGASWFSISSGISGTIREMAISKSNSAVMFATIGSTVYRSTNRGLNWSATSSGLPNRTITSVSIHPDSSNVVLVSFSGFGTGKVYRSTNTGSSWTNVTGNLPDAPVNNLLILPDAVGTYFVATDVGVFVTENFGVTWTEFASGLPNTVAMDLDYHEGTRKLRVGTHGRGVYESTLQQATIAVVSPSGAEQWAVGTPQPIQWSSSGNTGNVKIELSRNGGTTFPEVLFENTPNDGIENWLVTPPATAAGRVRISSISNPNVFSISNGNFSIVQPSMTVLAPAGGEQWNVGSIQTIMWSTQLITGNVRIELSRDDGVSYQTLFANTPNDGVEEWTVALPVSHQARIRVSSVSDPSIRDSSAASFVITTPLDFVARIIVTDNGNGRDTLQFGTARGATDGIDPVYGEIELPPRPPSGAFDVRWQVAGTQGTRRDIRRSLDTSRSEVTYTAIFQPGTGGYPVVLRWNRMELPPGTFIVRDEFTGGSMFAVDMKQNDTLTISHQGFQTFQVFHKLGERLVFSVRPGWNMISVPMTVSDLQKDSVFPSAISNAFDYITGQGYIMRDTLTYGKGYWLKFSNNDTIGFSGATKLLDTLGVAQGWNIIGSISVPIPVETITQIPPNIVISAFYGYGPSGLAQSDTVKPMHGYWVKVNQPGFLILNAGTVSE